MIGSVFGKTYVSTCAEFSKKFVEQASAMVALKHLNLYAFACTFNARLITVSQAQ